MVAGRFDVAFFVIVRKREPQIQIVSRGVKTDGGRHIPICRSHESVWLRIARQYFESNVKKETFLFVFCEIVYLWIWTESSTPPSTHRLGSGTISDGTFTTLVMYS